jgi:hypothetical protein
LSNKPSVQDLLHAHKSSKDDHPPSITPTQAQLDTGTPRPLVAGLWAINFDPLDSATTRTWKAVYGLGAELVKSFHYVGWIPVLLGMWWFRQRALEVPGVWVLLATCSLLAFVLWRLALTESYMSDRHLLLMVMAGCYAAMAALWELPARAIRAYRRQPWPTSAADSAMPSRATVAISFGLLALLLAFSLPKTLERLHGNRVGYHAAGVWLGEHAAPWDVIDDDHCWAHYYAGGVFLENHLPPRPPDFVPTQYVVVGRSDREHLATPNQQKPPPNEKSIQAHGGQVVFSWPRQSPPADASVVVYALPPAGTRAVRPQSQ